MIGYVVTVALSVGNVITASQWRKTTQLAALLLVVWMWILAWGALSTPDLDVYVRMYDTDYRPAGVGAGYWAVSHLGRIVGLEFTQFVAAVVGVSLILVFSTVWRFTDNSSYVALAYFAYPFAFDAIQIRSFLAYSLVIYGVRYLFSRSLKSSLKYVMCILVATSVHWAAAVYMVFLVPVWVTRRTQIRLAWLATVAGFFIVTMAPTLLTSLVEDLKEFTDSERIAEYFATRTQIGFFAFTGLQLAGIFLLRLLARAAKDYEAQDLHSRAGPEFVALSYRLLVMLLPLLPMYLINSNLWRMSRGMTVLIYLSAAVTRGYLGKDKWKQIHGTAWVTGYVLLLMLIQLFGRWEGIVVPLLTDNLLWGSS